MIFFWLSKIFWLFAAPDSLLVLLAAAAWIQLLRGKTSAARKLLATLVIALAAILALPFDEWIVHPLETCFPANPPLPEKVDGIIVLGGGQKTGLSLDWQQPELGDAAERLTAFVSLSRRYPDARLVFTGGNSSMLFQEGREADVAREFFRSQGLDLSRILFERESRNTYENAILSRRLAKPKPGEHWILITSAAHMPRALGVFCQAGWRVTPYPVDHRSFRKMRWRVDFDFAAHLEGLTAGTREWVGLLAYYLSGKTPALLPGECR